MLCNFNARLFLRFQDFIFVGIEIAKFCRVKPAIVIRVNYVQFRFDERRIEQRGFSFNQDQLCRCGSGHIF